MQYLSILRIAVLALASMVTLAHGQEPLETYTQTSQALLEHLGKGWVGQQVRRITRTVSRRCPAFFGVLDELAHIFISVGKRKRPAPVHLVVLPVWNQPVS